jgi:hypothetical protein
VQVPYCRPEELEPADADKVWFLGAVGRSPGEVVRNRPEFPGIWPATVLV